MSNISVNETAHRRLAITGLVAAPVLAVVSVVAQPDLPTSAAGRLASIDAAGWKGVASAAAFAASQLPMIAAALGIGHLLRNRAPRLGLVGAVLLVAGCFGHAVFGGMSLTFVAMSHDETHRAAYAGLMDQLMSSPMMLFSVLGLLGTVLGLLLLSIGLFRGAVGPRWVGPALWAFLVVEFVGSSISPRASYLSGLLLLAAFAALTVEAARSWTRAPQTDRSDVAMVASTSAS
jgi:hypothetical protein